MCGQLSAVCSELNTILRRFKTKRRSSFVLQFEIQLYAMFGLKTQLFRNQFFIERNFLKKKSPTSLDIKKSHKKVLVERNVECKAQYVILRHGAQIKTTHKWEHENFRRKTVVLVSEQF